MGPVMITGNETLSPGLYLIATPIGAARDITLRALDILKAADVIAAEDTRSLRRLMDIHGIPLRERSMLPYHDHNGAKVRPRILAALEAGKSVVYASEAGTPMVADPGFDLARDVTAQGYALISAPGPSAVITALTLSGLPTDQFFFAGFLPNASSRRKSALRALSDVPGTLVFYESPKRVTAMIKDAAECLGAERQGVICRELTKKFEETLRGNLTELSEICTERTLKGEVVVLIGKGSLEKISESDLDLMLSEALSTLSVRDAADRISTDLSLPRRDIYQRALAISAKND